MTGSERICVFDRGEKPDTQEVFLLFSSHNCAGAASGPNASASVMRSISVTRKPVSVLAPDIIVRATSSGVTGARQEEPSNAGTLLRRSMGESVKRSPHRDLPDFVGGGTALRIRHPLQALPFAREVMKTFTTRAIA
jgi:hypothetical protein